MRTAFKRTLTEISPQSLKSTETFKPTELDGLLISRCLDLHNQPVMGVWYVPAAADISRVLVDYELAETEFPRTFQNDFCQVFEGMISEDWLSFSAESGLTGWHTEPLSMVEENKLGWILTLWDNDIQGLTPLYEFRSPSEVVVYLRENAFLVPLLRDAHAQIRNYFGPDASTSLEVFVDPEADNSRRLFLYVTSPSTPEEAFDLLTALDEGWWLDAVAHAGEKLTIQVDYSKCSTGEST